MRKIIISLILVFMLCGCSSNSYENEEKKEELSEELTEELKEDVSKVDLMNDVSEEDFKEMCIELYYDDFFKEIPEVGDYVKFHGFISEKAKYTSSSIFGIVIEEIDDKYNFNKEYLGCCVMHEETRDDALPSYFGESVYLMFPSGTELDISCYESGQKIVVYGEVVQTWSGIFIIPKFIEEDV